MHSLMAKEPFPRTYVGIATASGHQTEGTVIDYLSGLERG